MKKFNKVIALVLALGLVAAILTGCSSGSSDDASENEATTHVKLGVTGAVHEQIWAPAIEALKAEGIEIEIVQFTEYTQPNRALVDGDVDLNAFQHLLYLNN